MTTKQISIETIAANSSKAMDRIQESIFKTPLLP